MFVSLRRIPSPWSAPSASDYNEKKAKKFNKAMEIQILYAFWVLMSKGLANILVSHEWLGPTLVYFPGFTFLQD